MVSVENLTASCFLQNLQILLVPKMFAIRYILLKFTQKAKLNENLLISTFNYLDLNNKTSNVSILISSFEVRWYL